MASGDRSNFLEIPGAWVFKELDLDLSLPASLTPSPSIQPAYITTSLGDSPTIPPCCDPLSPPSMPIVVHSTPRTSHPTLGPRKSNPRVRRATFIMPIELKTAVEAAPHNVLPLFDGASNASSTFLTSPVDAPPPPLPRELTETLSGDTTSVHSGVSELSFGPPGSPLSKCNSDFGFPTVHGDLAFKEFASRESLNYSAVDASPSSASINLVPSIPSIASDLQLHNFPISNGLPLEPHSVYFSAVEGDLSMSRRSDDGPEPVHEASSSSVSALELCIPSAEEAHYQIFSQENPSPRRRTVRIEVRNNILQQGAIRQESYTYACKSLPYDAGFRPHAYVDNREHATHGKHRLETMTEDFCATGGSTEEEGHVTSRSKLPAIFRKLGGKGLPKLMAFGPLKFKKNSKRFSTQSCGPNPHSPAVFSSVSNITDRSPVTTNYPNDPNCTPTPPPRSRPSSYPILDKKRPRSPTKKTRSGPRLLSVFVVPKPKVEGRVTASPKELPMCLPAGENLPPLSPLTSPQMRNAEIPQTDVHGRSYGPSRVASPEFPPRSPDPSISGRKEHRSWLTIIRSPKNSSIAA